MVELPLWFRYIAFRCCYVFWFFVVTRGSSASVCYTLRDERSDCKYFCHCAHNAACDRPTGACPGECDSDWFGPACQYEALALDVSGQSWSHTWLTDADHRTCNDGTVESVTVRMKVPQPLTWIRLVFNSEERLDDISLSYKPEGLSEFKQCPQTQIARVDHRTLDFSCSTVNLVDHVTLSGTGVRALCSVYASAGRNVALKQKAEQSSLWRHAWVAQNAVDGFKRHEEGSYATCTHTAENRIAWWSLSFRGPVEIYRLALYNRWDCCEERLRGFTVLVQDKNKSHLFSYTDKTIKDSDVYTIIPTPKITRPAYNIEVNLSGSNKILTLCEVTVNGETACPAGQFGRECERQCNCANQTDSCFVHSGGCPSGCAPGYTGEDCYTPCPRGQFGLGCNETCSEHCLGEDRPCNHADGSCDQGCEVGYLPPLCADECPIGQFGSDCNTRCSSHCEGQDHGCDSKTGSCDLGCVPGYVPPFCIDACTAGQFGLGCNESCSVHCKGEENPCEPTTGSCELGCDLGYLPPLCFEECPLTTHGEGCRQTCSDKCLNSLCHHKSGRCHQCQPGYRGYYCDLKCRDRTYGDECKTTCDANCLDVLCHHVTGKCYQCVDGKEGDFCQKVAARRSEYGGVFIGIAVGVALGLLMIITISIVYLYRGFYDRKKRRSPLSPVTPRSNSSSGRGMELSTLEKNQGQRKQSRQRPSKPQVHTIAEEEEHAPDNVYGNMPSRGTAVRVEDLKTFLQKHATDSLLREQFQSIPEESKYSRLNGHDPCNAKKNRYKNILPDDYTRVCLMVYGEYEDYINANYIKNYNDVKQAYIAAQAPMEGTLNEFVRMIWEQKIDRVIMLTKVLEGKKTKSAIYWPQDGPRVFGEITMELKSTQVYADYTVRHLSLSKRGCESRDLTQFHFTAWPDKSVPDSPWGVVDLYQRIMASPGSGPLLVHCSAGVGRTGTFIALCNLLQEAEATGEMNFLLTAWKLRQQRMLMIQTVEQYVFLHKTALVAHLVAGTGIRAQDVAQKLQSLQGGQSGESKTSSNIRQFSREFNALTEACFCELDEASLFAEDGENLYQNKRISLNKDKSRVKNIIPKDSHRPVLACETRSLSKYINAVLVPNLSSPQQDILTQLPLPSTVTDFWRLVTQYHVGLVVAFDTDSRHSDETVGAFLPETENDPIKTDLFEIQAKLTAESNVCQELLVTVFKKRKSIMTSAGEYHLTCLLCKTPGTDPKTILDIYRKIKYWKSDSPLRTIYMCRNGADQCGLMCIQSILLDRLEIDQFLTVPVVVGTIKAIRPQVIPTVDQYRGLYAALNLAYDDLHQPSSTTDATDTEYCNVGTEASLITLDDSASTQESGRPERDQPQSPLYCNQGDVFEQMSSDKLCSSDLASPAAQDCSREVQVSSDEAQVSSYEAQSTSREVHVSSHEGQNTSNEPDVSSNAPQRTSHEDDSYSHEAQKVDRNIQSSNLEA